MIRHMVQRSLSFVVLAGLMSCSGDPTGDLRGGFDHLQVDPGAIFVNEGTTKFVVITAVDKQGNSVVVNFGDPASVGAGITVAKDLTYQPVYDDKGNLVPPKNVVSTRYAVTANVNTGVSSFQVTAGGETVTVPVRIVPTNLAVGTLSNAAPLVGDTITMTVPAPYKLTPASVATVGTVALQKVSISADSTTIRAVVPGGLNGPVSVSNTILAYAPTAVTLAALSSVNLVTPSNLLTISKTNAAIGDTIVITAPTGYRFISGSDTASFGGAPFARLGVSTDSTQLRVLIGPNANSSARVGGMRIKGAPTFGPFALFSPDTVKTPVVTNFPATLSTATPSVNDTVVLTAPANMRFRPTATIAQGAFAPLILSRSADSTQIRFAPARAGGGPLTVTGVVFTTLTSVSLTLPTVASLTPPPARTGTDAIATAPTIALPAVGQSITVLDGGAFIGDNSVSGGVGNKFYKITVPASTSVTVNMQWSNTADIDILFGLADGSNFRNCFAGATGANPEQATCTLPTGDTILFANLFAGAAPGVLKIVLTRNN